MRWVPRRRKPTLTFGAHSPVVGPSGDVVGVWLENPDDTADPRRLGVLFLRNNWDYLISREFRRVLNTAGDRRGIYVMFFGYPAPCEQDFLPRSSRPPGPTGRVVMVTVDGQVHAVHEDFDQFANEAAAGRAALYRRRFDCLTADDVGRLLAVLAEAFGEGSPRFDAVADSRFYCLDCHRPYSMAWLFNRDMVTQGASSSIPDITHCLACGGQQAFWHYDPYQRRPLPR